jgi:hypothetical protein
VQPFLTSRFATEDPDFANALEIRRARLEASGAIHTKALQYKLQLDFGRGYVTLKDWIADVAIAPAVKLRAGQWKRPFSRQQINSSGRLEVTDRAITDRAFGAGRDIGIAVHNGYEDSPDLEWAVGVFNGTGDGARFVPVVDATTGAVTGGSLTNVPSKLRPVWVARAGINRGGIKGYTEADLEGGPLRYAVAANIALDGDNDDDDKSSQKAGVDYIAKVSGFSTTGALYLMTEQDGLALTDVTLGFVGFHVQGGYMVSPKVQVVGRYALIDARNDDTKDQQEVAVGGNFFGLGPKVGHDAKLAAAVRLQKTGDAKLTDGVLIEIGANIGF